MLGETFFPLDSSSSESVLGRAEALGAGGPLGSCECRMVNGGQTPVAGLRQYS